MASIINLFNKNDSINLNNLKGELMMKDNIREIELALEETEVDFGLEELEDIVTPGYGFGCDCS